MIHRFDFVFSYWIFVWYVLYECKIVSYNPKIALFLALIHNLLRLSIMIYFNNSIIYILLFILIQLCIKVYPLWSLRNVSSSPNDIYAMIGLFAIYNGWLWLNNENIVHLHKTAYYSIKHNTISTPIIYLVDKYVIATK
jgi:hypothetical protein